MPENFVGKIEDGAMVEAPIYEAHSRGKNWMATIEADPAAPGGLALEEERARLLARVAEIDAVLGGGE